MTEGFSADLLSTVLNLLNEKGTLKSNDIKFEGSTVDSQVLLGTLKKLASRNMVEYDVHEQLEWTPLEEGLDIIAKGSYEVRVVKLLIEKGRLTIKEVEAILGAEVCKLGTAKAFQKKLVEKLEGSVLNSLVSSVSDLKDDTVEQLTTIKQTGNLSDESAIKELKKRKLIDKVKKVSFTIRKGAEFALTIKETVTDVTTDMIKDGSWKTATIKPYNLKALGIAPAYGSLHPLLKLRQAFREIFFEMGFEEMPTNQYVESSFWNFDALFQPQQHPARDAHDTFFIKDPALSTNFPKEYLEKVRKVHTVGNYGSIGYRYDWKESEAQKNILRTHTTAVSTRMLYKLAQKKPFKPVKYFSIDKVFRNETLDATHLAEFHQIEGLIADYNLGLGDLIGVLNEFFQKLGMEELEFKPAYNPYTEPSMEVFAYHPGLKKRMEVGNSGIFRPEMLLPMGLPEGVTVIAWGLSLERPAMIQYKCDNIRDLVGHKVDIEFIKTNPICRLNQE